MDGDEGSSDLPSTPSLLGIEVRAYLHRASHKKAPS